MHRHIVVQEVSLDDVITFDKIRYNTNNVWDDDAQPADYKHVSSQTMTSKWIDGIKSYRTVRIDLRSVAAEWMKDAFKMGVHSGEFPQSFVDELDMFLSSNPYSEIFDGTEYFVRTETVSLKGGKHGVGPYTSLKCIVESLVTCHFGHTPIDDNTTEITLYLIPWTHISPDSEYRVFVHNQTITAISQQSLYHVYKSAMLEHYETHISIICAYYESVLKQHLSHVSSYCIDIAVLADYKPFFIEINPFGRQYSSGSSLFGWVQDEDILLGGTTTRGTTSDSSNAAPHDPQPIYFRYTAS